jgi:hypothetical protein
MKCEHPQIYLVNSTIAKCESCGDEFQVIPNPKMTVKQAATMVQNLFLELQKQGFVIYGKEDDGRGLPMQSLRVYLPSEHEEYLIVAPGVHPYEARYPIQ